MNGTRRVTELKENEILVVGTNRNGEHYGGAAAQAHRDFGLDWGVSEGMSGQTYAFPTLSRQMRPYNWSVLCSGRDILYWTARNNPGKTFLLTPVGTGIAGIDRAVIEKLFRKLPSNIKKVGW